MHPSTIETDHILLNCFVSMYYYFGYASDGKLCSEIFRYRIWSQLNPSMPENIDMNLQVDLDEYAKSMDLYLMVF
jgi:hypothetical protein